MYAQGAAKAQGGAARPPEKPRGVRPVRGAPPETASAMVYEKSKMQMNLIPANRFIKSKKDILNKKKTSRRLNVLNFL